MPFPIGRAKVGSRSSPGVIACDSSYIANPDVCLSFPSLPGATGRLRGLTLCRADGKADVNSMFAVVSSVLRMESRREKSRLDDIGHGVPIDTCRIIMSFVSALSLSRFLLLVMASGKEDNYFVVND
jgi:hypothetical protein